MATREAQEAARVWVRFGDLEFDGRRRELRRGGSPVRLSPRAFEVLQELLERAPAAVSKEALYRRLWGDGFVVEANIANLVSEVRAALGDSPGAARYIRTLHRFGYRFEAPLEPLEDPAALADAGGGGAAVLQRRQPSRFRLTLGDRSLALQEGENLLGRGEEADLQIDAAGVSRLHARITVAGEGATLEDLGSKNGTFLGEERIEAPAPLADGDLVRLGPTSLTLRVSSATQTTLTELGE